MSLANTIRNESKGLKIPEGPDTLYGRARKGWDDRLGDRVMQARNWRIAFLIASATTVISMVVAIVLATRPPLPPLVVEVDRSSGVANIAGRLNAQQYSPQRAEIEYFLQHFVNLIRPVPLDTVVLKKNWEEARYFMRTSASNELMEAVRSDGHHFDSPGGQAPKYAISVNIISTGYIPGSDSYQVRWREKVYDDQGVLKESYVMLGIFTIEVEPSQDENSVMINPLGIFIKHMQLTKEISESVTPGTGR